MLLFSSRDLFPRKTIGSNQFSFPKTFCAHCYAPVNPNDNKKNSSQQCDNCEKRLYCSKKCQREDWKSAAHRIYCGVAGEIGWDYEIRKVVGKNQRIGVGLFALRDFQKNDKILVERPLLVAPNDGRRSVVYPPIPQSAEAAVAAMLPHGGSIEQKMMVNAIDCTDEDAGLFLVMAIANHDCLGNADHMYLEEYGVRILVASRAIRQGEEIRHYYTDPLAPRQPRRAKLRRLYGFQCHCALCSSSALEAHVDRANDLSASMELLLEMGEVGLYIEEGKELLRVYDELAVLSTKLYMWVYFDLFRAAIMRKDTVEEGVQYLRQAHQCYVDYTGDSQGTEVKRMEELIDSPQSHRDYLALDRKK